MLAVAFGLGAALAWGLADFLGGIQSRRVQLLTVMFLSQAAGLVLVLALVAARGDGPPSGEDLLFGSLSSVVGLLALGAFYRGLAIGAMGVVAPISATAAVIPVAVGIATGERPSTVQVVGFAVALTGVFLASREPAAEGERRPGVAAGAGLALVAAAGFGCFFLLIDRASDGDVLWAILANRVTGVTVLVAMVLALRPRLGIAAGDRRALVAVGVLDITANSLFALASTEGLVSVVSVLASLYPVVVILLAHIVLRERVHRIQQVGAVGALIGVGLISGG